MNGEVKMLTDNDTITIFLKLKKIIYLSIKRVFDILVSIVGLLLLMPVALFIKIAYMLTGDFNRIFFVQERIGKNGKLFKFYKFRSMVPNADEILLKHLVKDPKLAEEYRINKKLKNDPRITKVGGFIRRHSLDELPQFINVFLGDMSVIGNRPYLPREIPDMGEYYEDIIKTRPGITGLWQVSGRNDVSFKKRLKLEKEYSNCAGIKIDIKIFFKTFKVVICGWGAK